jgi:hypothetical protein
MKYRNFRTVARVFEVLAWVVGIAVFGMSLAGGFVAGGLNVVIGILMGAVGGFLAFAFLYAAAQFIYVIIDIERNTRATLRALLEEVETEEPVESEVRVKTKEGQ